MNTTNQAIEQAAIQRVLDLERLDGRDPMDARGRGSVDVISSDRHIEVKAFGGSARGQFLWLEEAQVQEARDNPNFWLYVVDNVRQGDPGKFGVIRLSRDEAIQLIERGRWHVHVETTLPTAEYDARVVHGEADH